MSCLCRVRPVKQLIPVYSQFTNKIQQDSKTAKLGEYSGVAKRAQGAQAPNPLDKTLAYV